MVTLYYSSRLIGELRICVLQFSLPSFWKSRGRCRTALLYSAPSSGLFTEAGRVTSGGKMHGRHLH